MFIRFVFIDWLKDRSNVANDITKFHVNVIIGDLVSSLSDGMNQKTKQSYDVQKDYCTNIEGSCV